MAKKNYYAVKEGRKTGIFRSWDECRKQVDGYSGAKYKGFVQQSEAEMYLNGGVYFASSPAVSADTLKQSNSPKSWYSSDEVKVYVDGSYDYNTKAFSYGVVILVNGFEIKLSEKFSDPSLASMHNVTGEIKGAEAAMKYALNNGIQHLVIYHDYNGIAKWCTGEWRANKPGTIAYRDFYVAASKKVKIDFVKVKGHSGDKYNNVADSLAKSALGLL